MFEILTWAYKFIFVPLVLGYAILAYFSYFKNSFLKRFLPVLIVMLAASAFALISLNLEPIDYNAVYIGGLFIASYLLLRHLLKRLAKLEDFLLFDNVNFLLIIGLIMLYRLNPEYAIRQFAFIAIGYAVLFCITILNKESEISEKSYILTGAVILLLLLTTQVFGTQINGSKNWIKIFSFYFQPSELLKILFVFFIACLLNKNLNLKRFICISAAVLTVVSFFALQKDLGSALIFFTVYLIMLAIRDEKLIYTGISVFIAVLGAIGSYITFSHIRSRVLAWTNPWKYVSGKSYQITQSLFAIASGGLLGAGLYGGNPNFIPEIHNDFIFSAICEEMGILCAISLLSIYALVIIIGMDIGIKCNNRINAMVALGLTSVTAVQTLVIIGGVLNLIPITGVTLPFISSGGSSLISQFINIGLLYFISRKEKGESNEQ